MQAWSSCNLLLSSGQATREAWACAETSSPTSRKAQGPEFSCQELGQCEVGLSYPKAKWLFQLPRPTCKEPSWAECHCCVQLQSNSFSLPALSQGRVHPKEYCDRHIRAEKVKGLCSPAEVPWMQRQGKRRTASGTGSKYSWLESELMGCSAHSRKENPSKKPSQKLSSGKLRSG